jgi:hypothetical protein
MLVQKQPPCPIGDHLCPLWVHRLSGDGIAAPHNLEEDPPNVDDYRDDQALQAR